MSKYIKFIVILICVLALGARCARQRYPEGEAVDTAKASLYYVTRIVDGDTVELSNGERLRYIGIDAPEVRKRRGGQWVYEPDNFALEAREFNQKLVEHKWVRLEFDVQKRDKYGRLLAYVFVDDTFVNEKLIKEGLAVLFAIPPNVKYVDEFIAAQKEARELKKGAWAR